MVIGVTRNLEGCCRHRVSAKHGAVSSVLTEACL
jgi:hypothetical protein